MQNALALLTSRKALLTMLAAVVASLLMTGVGYAALSKSVVLSVDGKETKVRTLGDTVGEVLDDRGLEVGEHDVVAPSLDTPVDSGTHIAVRFGRPLDVSVDGKTTRYWVTATDVDTALDQLGLRYADAALSTSRSSAIGRGGLDLAIVTPKKLTVVDGNHDAVTRTVRAVTVSQALEKFGARFDENDRVKPGFGHVLKGGETIRLTHVRVVTKHAHHESYGPTTVRQYDSSMYSDESVTLRSGHSGVRNATYKLIYENGRLVRTKLVKQKVLTPQLPTLVRVGTKDRPTANYASGSTVWDRLAQCESGGNWAANTGNGYYGGLQFNLSTWQSYGGSGLPSDASRETQIAIATKVRDASGGYGAWPACAAELGLPT